MTTLAQMQAHYLATREHTLSTDKIPNLGDRIEAQAQYALGEAREMTTAAHWYARALGGRYGAELSPAEIETRLRDLRHEIADHVLAAVGVANLLGVDVEACIAEKTEADRGRG